MQSNEGDDSSDWMSKIHDLLVHGAAAMEHEDQSTSSHQVEDDEDLHDGDVAFVFDGMPFHLVGDYR